jgi:effector-binding domain-containing protein
MNGHHLLLKEKQNCHNGSMISEPRIDRRDSQAYVGLRTSVKMQDFPPVIDRSLAELRQWIGQHHLEQQVGPPVFRYWKIDMDGEMDVEFCIPLSAAAPGDGPVQAGTLPAGRYATLIHTGHYEGLRDATGYLLKWGEEQGLRWQTDPGGEWRARLETYLTDPSQEPNPALWETELAILIAE